MERRKDGRYAKGRGRYKRRILLHEYYKKGMELIIKGDSSVFDHSINDTAISSDECVAVFCEQHFYATLSGLRCLVFQPYTYRTVAVAHGITI